jgi:hypothetical protein
MTDPVRQIADAVLYEGYILWPYRRSAMKNKQRWTFGGVYPRAWSVGHGDDRWQMQTECLVRGEGSVDVTVRFLHVVRRQVLGAGGEPLDELTVEGERHLSWEEASERQVEVPGLPLARLAPPVRVPVEIAHGCERAALGADASVMRTWHALEGVVEIGAEPLGDGFHRLTVRIANTTAWPGGTREEVLQRTFCSCHTGLRARDAEFVSMTDPPVELREDAEACVNEGTWPVLVGETDDHSTMLSSPIILEDHPRIAPESPGDLFDGGEIDQLLVLNILSLTDEEKDEMRASDPRAREILERTEALTPEQLMRLHGTIRDLRYSKS